MHFQNFLLAASAIYLSTANPLPQGTGKGADSCATDPLTTDTWKKLGMDTFLKNWSAKNVTQAKTNNVQALADSFGAPNFFCGLDNFCNAGQPCLPVQLPAWYGMVAIQNWNSYMNSVNTAINFASTIVSLTLPGIVSDLYPKPKDDVTPLVTMSKVFTTALGVIPFTGPISTAASAVSGSVSFLTGRVKVPAQADLFLKWSDVSSSLATVVSNYQAAVSDSIKATLDAPVNDASSGINTVLVGGQFLGIAQNFTQSDLQSEVTDSIKTYAIGLVLQAQKLFIYKYPDNCNEDDQSASICNQENGKNAQYLLINAQGTPQNGIVDTLTKKYGMSTEQIFIGPTRCFDANGKKQLADPFNKSLPLDKNTDCLFNLQVCLKPADVGPNDTFSDQCKAQGLDI